MSRPFSEQITQHSNYLQNFALHLTRDRDKARDLYQETLTKALCNEHRYQTNSNFKAWAITIMRNNHINAHRGMSKATLLVDASDMQNGIYDKRTTHNDGEKNVSYESLLQMVNTLDERKKTIFLHYVNGYSYEELSANYNLTIQNLRSIVFSARKELQNKLYGLRAIS